jgi:hypothetical protein
MSWGERKQRRAFREDHDELEQPVLPRRLRCPSAVHAGHDDGTHPSLPGDADLPLHEVLRAVRGLCGLGEKALRRAQRT